MDIEEKLDKIKSDIRKLQLELSDKQEEYIKIIEELYEKDPSMVRVVCFSCNGQGYKKIDGRNRTCDVCGGKRYLWMKKWQVNEK